MSTGLHGAAGGGADQVMYTCDMEAAGPFRSVLPAACPVGRGVPRCRSALTAHGNLRSIKIDSFEGGKQDLTEGFSAEEADQLLAVLLPHVPRELVPTRAQLGRRHVVAQRELGRSHRLHQVLLGRSFVLRHEAVGATATVQPGFGALAG